MPKSPVCTRARKNQYDITDLMGLITKVDSGMGDVEEMKTRLESVIQDVEELKQLLEMCIRRCDNSFLTASNCAIHIIHDALVPVTTISLPDILEKEIEAGRVCETRTGCFLPVKYSIYESNNGSEDSNLIQKSVDEISEENENESIPADVSRFLDNGAEEFQGNNNNNNNNNISEESSESGESSTASWWDQRTEDEIKRQDISLQKRQFKSILVNECGASSTGTNKRRREFDDDIEDNDRFSRRRVV